MNNDNFLIEESDLELAKDICKVIENPEVRNRAVANALAADIAKKYFTEIEVDTESGLHHIPQVLSDIDIADIYIKDSYIDVRIYFNDNELCVPKSHFDRNLLPVAYMFIKLDEELSGGMVAGFALPNSFNTEECCKGYYHINEDNLISFYDIESFLVTKYDDNLPDNFDSKIFEYLDGSLRDVNAFYRTLLESKEGRRLLKDAACTQNIFNFVSESITETQEKEPSNEPLITNDVELLEESGGEIDLLEEADEAVDLLEETELPDISLDAPELELDEPESLLDRDDAPMEPLEEFETDISEEAEDVTTETDTIEDLSMIEESEPEEVNSLDVDNASIGFLPLDEIPTNDEPSISFSEPTVEPISAENQDETLAVENNTPEYEILPEVKEEEEETPEILDVIEELPEVEADITIEETKNVPEEDNTAIETETPEYSTNVTPSIDSIEQTEEDDLEHLLDNDKSVLDEEQTTVEDENTPQIEELFGEEAENQEVIEETFVKPVKNKGTKVLPLLGTLVIIGALGYFGYTKFINPQAESNDLPDPTQEVLQPEEQTATPAQEAMPIETVENVAPTQNSNEGNAISIPAIEQNLDASILVSNLGVTWEVPSGYVSNNTAQRYFRKMGKIIQLNLKTELLLLNKPPITNKIMLELQFNKNTNKFDVKGITASSGEKAVDDLIVRTVKNALNINLKTNMSTFSGISGNPVLIIRL